MKIIFLNKINIPLFLVILFLPLHNTHANTLQGISRADNKLQAERESLYNLSQTLFNLNTNNSYLDYPPLPDTLIQVKNKGLHYEAITSIEEKKLIAFNQHEHDRLYNTLISNTLKNTSKELNKYLQQHDQYIRSKAILLTYNLTTKPDIPNKYNEITSLLSKNLKTISPDIRAINSLLDNLEIDKNFKIFIYPPKNQKNHEVTSVSM